MLISAALDPHELFGNQASVTLGSQTAYGAWACIFFMNSMDGWLDGMAWHGMAWHGMAWHGIMAWHGMAWHGWDWIGLLFMQVPGGWSDGRCAYRRELLGSGGRAYACQLLVYHESSLSRQFQLGESKPWSSSGLPWAGGRGMLHFRHQAGLGWAGDIGNVLRSLSVNWK